MEKDGSPSEALKKEKYVGITVLGYFFISFSFWFIFEVISRGPIFYECVKQLQSLLSEPVKVRSFFPKLIIWSIVGFCYLFLTGVGIMSAPRKAL